MYAHALLLLPMVVILVVEIKLIVRR